MNVQKVKLNIVPGGIIPVANLSQGDYGREIMFEIYDGISPANLTDVQTAFLSGEKPDGKAFSLTGTISGNTVSVTSSYQSTALSGQIEAKLVLIDSDSQIKSALLIWDVEADPSSGSVTSNEDIQDVIAAALEIKDDAAQNAYNASESALASAESAAEASESATDAAESESNAEAWAVGKRGGVPVPETDDTYHNNSEYYKDLTESIADRVPTGLNIKGTITFSQLPSIADSFTGDTWNVTDAFTTTSDFRGGAGISVEAGSFVYLTSDNQWDVLGTKFVQGVKGNAETNYRIGNVNLTPANIGALATNGASTNTTVAFTTNDLAANTTEKTSNTTNQPSTVAKLSSGETLASMFNKISSMFASIRKLWNTVNDITVNNAGAHNAVYRGKALGSSVTSAQYAEINAGTFKDLYIGDYWTINGVNYRIAAFDYWLNTGDTDHVVTDHHVVIVPDTNLDTQKMNDSNVTTGGYVGSKMYTTYMATAKSTIQTAFGSTNILSHRELFTNAVSSDKASGWAWYDSTIDLMNESMVYGHEAWANHPGYETAIDKGQLPLFSLDHSKIIAFNNGTRAGWWLRDVVSVAGFANVYDHGFATGGGASNALGVRPAFAIYKP